MGELATERAAHLRLDLDHAVGPGREQDAAVSRRDRARDDLLHAELAQRRDREHRALEILAHRDDRDGGGMRVDGAQRVRIGRVELERVRDLVLDRVDMAHVVVDRDHLAALA